MKAATKLQIHEVEYIISENSTVYNVGKIVMFTKYTAILKATVPVTCRWPLAICRPACLTCHNVLYCMFQDGYRQLALLPVNALKGCVRVKFINEQVCWCTVLTLFMLNMKYELDRDFSSKS